MGHMPLSTSTGDELGGLPRDTGAADSAPTMGVGLKPMTVSEQVFRHLWTPKTPLAPMRI